MENGSQRVFDAPVLTPDVLLRAQDRVVACQACSQSVSRSFGTILTEVFGAESPASEYSLGALAECPCCGAEIFEETLIRTDGDLESMSWHDPSGAPADWRESWYESGQIVLITEEPLLEAQAFIGGCVLCAPLADLTFSYLLDEISGSDPTSTAYVLCRPARCPNCYTPISEKTLVVGCGPGD